MHQRIIIVNADDFGASRETNQAIIRSFQKGLISSATVMANMPAFQSACQLVHEHSLENSIGLHLNLTLGRPLTAEFAECSGLCDTDGCFRPLRRILRLNAKETMAVEAEITAQFMACKEQGITPTHMDSHQHIHTQFGLGKVFTRMAKRLGIRAIRVGRNCGPFASGSSAAHRMLAHIYRHLRNSGFRFHRLGVTRYFGDALDTEAVLRKTRASVEVMVHPRLNSCGRLVDLDGEDLESRIRALNISPADMCSYAVAIQIAAKRGLVPIAITRG